MRKVFLVVFAVLTLSAFVEFPSSDSVADHNLNLLIGKWQLVKTSSSEDSESCTYKGWINFKSNHKVDLFDACDTTSEESSWKVDGDWLAWINDNYTDEYKILTLNKTTLVIAEGTDSLTYRRI